ncbi:hypothetical protein [Mucisphaera calidilacus]|uniref:Uncharacterized protein n=1 Tax=Mucisphaera calidilacus TaxID=2527982 RepID=A0A518BTT0_9BACT|nr:hypothetical protein [Mucisphaera calidilacus]QDU70378.1 hypothetical protein Pan265_02040 [Mucisphaera calidilacus]
MNNYDPMLLAFAAFNTLEHEAAPESPCPMHDNRPSVNVLGMIFAAAGRAIQSLRPVKRKERVAMEPEVACTCC